MLKFIKSHMATITDIELYPVLSFLIFFTLFVAILVHTFLLRKSEVRELAALPIVDEPGDAPYTHESAKTYSDDSE